MMEQITIDGVEYVAQKIHPSETTGKHCLFYGNDWYSLEVKYPAKKWWLSLDRDTQYNVIWDSGLPLKSQVHNYDKIFESKSTASIKFREYITTYFQQLQLKYKGK